MDTVAGGERYVMVGFAVKKHFEYGSYGVNASSVCVASVGAASVAAAALFVDADAA